MSVNLCIDWGNTNVKAAIFDNDRLLKSYTLAPEKIMESIAFIMDNYKPQKAILCSVAEHTEELVSYIGNRLKAFVILDGYTRLPINNAYLSNDTIGADRLAMVTAAHIQNPNRDNLVICIGTCITYNFITKNRTFRGGAISPGVNMRLKAMHHFTDRLPEVSASDDFLLIGYDTPSCMISGTLFGIIHEIEGMLSEYESAYPHFNAILTGGDAPFFATKLKSKIFADTDLLLKGLNLIVNYNVPHPL